jgi:hypothetical protein
VPAATSRAATRGGFDMPAPSLRPCGASIRHHHDMGLRCVQIA